MKQHLHARLVLREREGDNTNDIVIYMVIYDILVKKKKRKRLIIRAQMVISRSIEFKRKLHDTCTNGRCNEHTPHIIVRENWPDTATTVYDKKEIGAQMIKKRSIEFERMM